jgi:hypothetical protein
VIVRILWATTFSADLWQDSGRLLVESFLATKTPGTLVAYTEGIDVPAAPNVLTRRIDKDPFLVSFLQRNRDVIPIALGGVLPSPECHCRGREPLDMHSSKHTLPCPGYWFCKNAYRWLRKPLAAKKACDEFGADYDIMMWVDSDASFLKTIPPEVVASWFPPDTGCIFLKNKRLAIETGVFGYHLKQGGPKIADTVLKRYETGVFRKDHRWDDCVQLWKGIAASGVKAVDLATKVGERSTVIQFSPLAPYLGHDKGRHLRTKRLV